MSDEPRSLTRKIIDRHVVDGTYEVGAEIGLRIDQTLTQDATGTLVMLELEALELDRVRTEVSVQYVDHNLVQEDFKNADDHRFLRSACERFGIWFSRPGNGVSHPLHQSLFGVPGRTLLGSDSHTPAAGAIGMLAIGAGGIEVAMAMAGQPFYLAAPAVWGIELTGRLPDWVSAKDVILELLRRHGVQGGTGHVLEYHGEGLDSLSAMDRHVIANMGTELGATSSVFPSDDVVREFLRGQGREDSWTRLEADEGAPYDRREVLDLSALQPLVAMPSSPGNVVTVEEIAGEPIHQAYIGSSANPGFRDIAVVADIVDGERVHPRVSLDINPATRGILAGLIRSGHLARLIGAGARLHQAGCNGCIGMGQAPATGTLSLRTVPRNFPGRSGTPEDRVALVSPETAAASALAGVVTDPRTLEGPSPRPRTPEAVREDVRLFLPPRGRSEEGGAPREGKLHRGPNIRALPELAPLPESLAVKVALVVGDDISTDEILPAGARVLPYRSNIPRISEFAFEPVDADYAARARSLRDDGGHAIVAGENYGQGSSREHAALAPRFLGLKVVVAKSFARIHWQNLINHGVLPLTFADRIEGTEIPEGCELRVPEVARQLRAGRSVTAEVDGRALALRHALAPRQVDVLVAGGLINRIRARLSEG